MEEIVANKKKAAVAIQDRLSVNVVNLRYSPPISVVQV
jgi:hypothetical protein